LNIGAGDDPELGMIEVYFAAEVNVSSPGVQRWSFRNVFVTAGVGVVF
jgi:hypothetical protein